jgi:hypothetical protein
MPVALGVLLAELTIAVLPALGVSGLTTLTIAAAVNSPALIGLGLAIAGNFALQAFASKPAVPKPTDGRYNLRQNVPSLPVLLGRGKWPGDMNLLEERGGTAFQVIVHAGHRIEGYVQHWLHDEAATLDVDGYVIAPAHFASKVRIESRIGQNAETAYESLIDTFPEAWTADHRGDGLAHVLVEITGASAKNQQKTFPQGMPSHSAVIDGALVFDPREESHDPDDPGTWSFSQNLALLRLHHLTHPWGGKLEIADLYLPDWIAAADVCDEQPLDRDGNPVRRYWGGLRFRQENDPVEVGRILDQAADMVVYERPDGLVGVHAGRFVEPDVRLTTTDLVSVTLDANRRQRSTVLAVRGRYTAPLFGYNTVDAAIYGAPYVGEATERTKTVDNVAVQHHNHMQRLQALALARANAPRVSCVAHYDAARLVASRRFVTVHYPPRLTETVIELTGKPQLSLANLTISFEGIVVDAALYDFDAATQEGVAPTPGTAIVSAGIPVPANFDVEIERAAVASGSLSAFAVATWDDAGSDTFAYELEFTPATTGIPESVISEAGETTVKTPYLADGIEYSFRLRTWSAGTVSDWTSPIVLTAVADTTAPGALSSFSVTGGLGMATVGFATGSDAHAHDVALYRVPKGGGLDRAMHFVEAVPVSKTGTTVAGRVHGDATRTNLWPDPAFTGVAGVNYNTGWSRNAGTNRADHASAAANAVFSVISPTAGVTYRWGVEIAAETTAGTGITPRLGTSPITAGTPFNGVGLHLGKLVAQTGQTNAQFLASTWVGSIDNAVWLAETAQCAPQGEWDYYAEVRNPSGVHGATSGPIAITIY